MHSLAALRAKLMEELSELLSVNCAFGDTQALLLQKISIFEMTPSISNPCHYPSRNGAYKTCWYAL